MPTKKVEDKIENKEKKKSIKSPPPPKNSI